MPVAVDPVSHVFKEQWPQARVTHLLDDALPADLTAAGGITPPIIERFVALARYCEASGANAILFTCSAFGSAIDAAKQAVRVPVLKPNEAMLDEALLAGADLALIATFEPSIPSLRKELEELAASRGMQLRLKTRTVPAAIAALQKGQGAEHDRLIAAAARELGPCDALVLGQFSMARAAARIAMTPGCKVLTSPHSAVSRLKQMFNVH